MRRKKRIRNRKSSNKLISFVIVLVVMILSVFLGMKGNEIKAQNTDARKQIEELKDQLSDAKQKSKDLDEYSKYVNTKQFVEDIARSKLGLIYPNEIIFKPESK